MAHLTGRLGAMQDLHESVMEIERDQIPNAEALKRVEEIVTKAEKLLDNEPKKQMELLVDGQIFLAGQKVFRSAVQNLDTNLEPFSLDNYANGIIAYLQSSSSLESKWKELASDTYCLVKASPKLDFRLGTFILEPAPKPEKVVKERQARGPKTEKAVVKAADEPETPVKAGKQNTEHILTSLARCYRKSKDHPINYFKFVIDPTDFWRTVNNIYYVSHLVKDNMVKMTIIDGQPMLEPRKKNDERKEAQDHRNRQFNFRVSPPEYRLLIGKYNVKEALIPPIKLTL